MPMAKSPPEPPARTRRWAFKSVVLLLGVGLLLFGLVALGKWAWDQIRSWDRYTVAFTDIACPSPPGQPRADFLDEVQYLAGLPDRLRLLDEDLAPRLAAAFALHPWVERVTGVEVLPP